jgi:cytochrome d ubiquinol oxidase subunit II
MFPYVDRATGLTVSEAIVSTLPLNLMSIMAAVLLPIVLSYFGILYTVFSGPVEGGGYA